MVKASTGLGLGIVAGGRVVGGHLGAAGEIGHTRVEAAEGMACRCGATGCLETLAAGWALVARLDRAGVGHVRDLVALAQQGDAEARGLLREGGRRLGEVLAVAVNLLNPQAVVIGGDMAGAFDLYAAGVRESVYALAAPLGHPRPAVPAHRARRQRRPGRLRRPRPGEGPPPRRRGRPPRCVRPLSRVGADVRPQPAEPAQMGGVTGAFRADFPIASGACVFSSAVAPLAQSAERLHGKEKVYGSIP